MKYHLISSKKIVFFFLYCFSGMYAQNTVVKGKIIDAVTGDPLEKTIIQIKETNIRVLTNTEGEFNFNAYKLPFGEQILVVSKEGYSTRFFPVIINQEDVLDLQYLELSYDFSKEQEHIGTISLSDDELNEGSTIFFGVNGLLQSTRDVFLTAAAFDFGTAFFRPRGLRNEYSTVLINGIKMNKLTTGRPEWNNWGGLNDVQRNQEFSIGISENEYTFGNLLGTSAINMRASKYRKGSRLSFASSNRNYQGRIMGTYNSGMTKKGWALSVSLSRRYGEGFIEGTIYDANSFFISVEKQLSNKHSINLTGFYTPNRRGMSTAVTKEVNRIKGNRYNPNWGYQNGQKRNSREKKVEEPLLMLNHYWKITENTRLQTNVAYQMGKTTKSRIDNGGSDLLLGSDKQKTYVGKGRSKVTNPVHVSNMPSYFLQNNTPTPLQYQNAYMAEQHLINDGQLDWDTILQINQENTSQGNNATYILFDDRTDSKQLSANVILNSKLSSHIFLNAAVNYRNLNTENFAEVTDLLGGKRFLDINVFGLSAKEYTHTELINKVQSDLRIPDRIVRKGDRYQYNYEIEASDTNGFLQGQFKFKRCNFFLGGTISQTSYQRNGLFENGYFLGNDSYGKSESLNFINYGVKAGATYAIDGHHYLKFHGAYFNKAPVIQNAFVNARQNNITVAQLTGGSQESEKIRSADMSYIFRSPKINARVTGYYSKVLDGTRVSFFYTEAISGYNRGFVQEVLTDIDKLYMGGELGVTYQITPTLKLKGAGAMGHFVFDNNPDLTLTSTSEAFIDVGGIQHFGKSYLKGYKLAVGPQNAIQLGFEYNDPNFWWFGATYNHFSKAFINVSPFKRTENFYKDIDGLPFNDYDPSIANTLVEQEEFKDYFLINAIGGKSWKIKKYYVGFFASINNILNQEYKTGGFEQSRNANYRLALADSQRDTPLYGSKYYFGTGTSYYFNVYIRF